MTPSFQPDAAKRLAISVVIVTHNRAKELVTCLGSFQGQTRAPDEIIVINNASTDNTLEILSEHFPYVRIISADTNLGIPKGRNLGIQQSSGDISISIDDDATIIEPDALEKIARYFQDESLLACLSFKVLDAQDKPAKPYIPRRDRKILMEDSYGAFFTGGACALRRDIFMALGGFWENLGLYFGEEVDMSYRMLEGGYRILHTVHVAIRHYESSTTRPSGRRIYHGSRNIPWIAIRHLPWPCIISLTVMSWGYYAIQAVRHHELKAYLKGIKDSFSGMPVALSRRKCICPDTIKLVRRYSGVYFY